MQIIDLIHPSIHKTMKKRYLATLLSCLITGLSYAATISGTVLNMTTGAPVANQVVTISDTNHTYALLDTTDAMGVYSIQLPGSTPSPLTLLLSTYACGMTNDKYFYYTGTSQSVNLNVCVSPSAAILHGEIVLTNSSGMVANNGAARIYLIRKQYDPVVMDTTLTAIDSFTSSSTGGAFSKLYTTVPTGTLFLKVALLPSHPNYASYAPTYYISSLSWTTAHQISAAVFAGNYLTDVLMTAGVNPGGPGFIGGSVLLGANKGTAVGDPLSSRILLLTNSADQPVAYTYSDASGHFQFPNLQYGTYKVFGDAMGKTNPPLSVTLSATKATVNNIIFEENNKTFQGKFGTVSIVNVPAALNGISIYPNPATDHIQIDGISAIRGSKNIMLTDLTGAVISQQVCEEGNNATIATDKIAAGIYLLKVQTTAGTLSLKFVK
jgi:hypothetical protein